MRWDPTLNVEGVATAAAALSAALAFIVDLTTRRLREWRARRRGNRGRFILDLAARSDYDGVTREQIEEALSSREIQYDSMRRRHGVRRSVIDDDDEKRDLDVHLLSLVYDRMLEMDAVDHYRMYGWDEYRRKHNLRLDEEQQKYQLRDDLAEKLTEELWSAVAAPTSRSWAIGDALAELARLGRPATSQQLRKLIDDATGDHRHDVVNGVTRYVSGGS